MWPDLAGANKKPKKIENYLAGISYILKTVWQGESGVPKTVSWFSELGEQFVD